MLHRIKSMLSPAKLGSPEEKLQDIIRYVAEGCPIPAPMAVKQEILKFYRNASGARVFIETGTHMGNTVTAMSPYFDVLYTIELSKPIFDKAAEILAKHQNIRPLFGSSADWLPKIFKEVGNQPALVWLDAHASGGETAGPEHDPLYIELETAYAHRNEGHIFLVDDARGLSLSLDQLRAFARKFEPTHSFTVTQDIIRIVPKGIPAIGQPIF